MSGHIQPEFPMVRSGSSEADIEAFLKEGWNFRVKVVKGRRYVTRRKGQQERSLGPYSEELWDTIVRVRKLIQEEGVHVPQKERVDDSDGSPGIRSDLLKAAERNSNWLDQSLDLERSVYMMTRCVHRDDDGNCIYWAWGRKPGFFEHAEALFLAEDFKLVRVLGGNEAEKWVVRASTWFCKHCPSFLDSQL